MGSAIDSFGYPFAKYAINATSNPFIGLFIGLLSTALLQSSSTSTTIAVAAVASGSITLEGAIPIILGANVGTTLTSTIVSMGYITKATEFRKAVAAATVHDFFNILMVAILFPLELKYHLLAKGSTLASGWIGLEHLSSQGLRYSFTSFFQTISHWLLTHTGSIFALLLSILLLFICLKSISKLLYNLLIGRAKKQFETTVFSNTARSFGWGLLITSAVQSSSLTTSLIVPLVATGKVNLKRAFQFVLGANIGTTITALLAALFQSEAALSLALVHLLFNLVGVILFLLVPYISNLPVYLANQMGFFTLRLRMVGFAYILIAFFLVPFTLIYFSQGIDKRTEEPTEIRSED